MKKYRVLAFLALLVIGIALQGCSSDEDTPANVSPQPDGKLVVGDAAPEFTLTNSEGDPVSLSDYRGKPTLLYFHMAMG